MSVSTATSYPFRLPDRLISRLPRAGADGLSYIDVKVDGKWDGILVVDPEGNCRGVHVRRQVEEFPLDFESSQIEDVRAACLWNRLLAQIPLDFFDAALLLVFVVSPVVLLMSLFLLPPLSLVSTTVCLLAIFVMYKTPGFIFIRLPAALFALAQAISGIVLFATWLIKLTDPSA